MGADSDKQHFGDDSITAQIAPRVVLRWRAVVSLVSRLQRGIAARFTPSNGERVVPARFGARAVLAAVRRCCDALPGRATARDLSLMWARPGHRLWRSESTLVRA